MLRVRLARVTAAVVLSLAAVSAGGARNCDDWMCGMNGTSLNGVWDNGTTYQGWTMQGTRLHGRPGEAISSAGLVRVELPR
jgi:hypothetical protein